MTLSCHICQGPSNGDILHHPLGLLDSTRYLCGDCVQRVAEEWPRVLATLRRDAAIVRVLSIPRKSLR